MTKTVFRTSGKLSAGSDAGKLTQKPVGNGVPGQVGSGTNMDGKTGAAAHRPPEEHRRITHRYSNEETGTSKSCTLSIAQCHGS